MRLEFVPPAFIDRAWRDGAHLLSESCNASGGEITADQLKLILSRGERTLICADDNGRKVGWAVITVEQLPNLRVLYMHQLYAPHIGFERFFDELKAYGQQQGCSRFRCAAKPAQARLYRMKVGLRPVYETLETEL